MKPDEYEEIKELYDKSLIKIGKREKDYFFSNINRPENLHSNRTRRTFYASDATKCERAIAWAVTGVPKSNAEITQKSRNIFALGDAVHEVLEDRYKKITGWQFFAEHPGEINIKNNGEHSSDFLLHYRVDGVMLREDWSTKPILGVQTDKIICEFKTIADFPYNTGRNRAREVYWHGAEEVPKSDHFAQLQIGMYGEGADYGLLHYHNKNNGDEAIHLMEINIDYCENLIEKLWTINDNALEGKIPDRPYTAFPSRDRKTLQKSKKVGENIEKSAWQCLFCDFRDKCWKLNEFMEEDD